MSLTNLCGQLVVTGILMDAILLKSPTPHGEGAFGDRAPSTQPARLYRRCEGSLLEDERPPLCKAKWIAFPLMSEWFGAASDSCSRTCSSL